MSQQWLVTKHAIERYIERRAPGVGEQEAREAIIAASLTATPLKERTLAGQTQWKTQDGLIFITKHDKKKTFIVTILSEEEQASKRLNGKDFTESEMEIIRESCSTLKMFPQDGRKKKAARTTDAEPENWRDHRSVLENRIRELKIELAQNQAGRAKALAVELAQLKQSKGMKFWRAMLRWQAEALLSRAVILAAGVAGPEEQEIEAKYAELYRETN